MSPVPKSHPLHRWFAVLVESSFQEKVGVCAPPVLDYLTGLLTEFIHVERINLLDDGSCRPVEDIAEMLTQAEDGSSTTTPERRRRYHRHIGDFTLFWTGVYPENLRRLHRRHARDELMDYFDQGKRSYAIASRLSSDQTRPPAAVLQMLSDQFEYCVYGLGLVRREWERTSPPDLGSTDLLSN